MGFEGEELRELIIFYLYFFSLRMEGIFVCVSANKFWGLLLDLGWWFFFGVNILILLLSLVFFCLTVCNFFDGYNIWKLIYSFSPFLYGIELVFCSISFPYSKFSPHLSFYFFFSEQLQLFSAPQNIFFKSKDEPSMVFKSEIHIISVCTSLFYFTTGSIDTSIFLLSLLTCSRKFYVSFFFFSASPRNHSSSLIFWEFLESLRVLRNLVISSSCKWISSSDSGFSGLQERESFNFDANLWKRIGICFYKLEFVIRVSAIWSAWREKRAKLS